MNRIFLIFLTLIYSGSSFSFELVQNDEWSSLIRSDSIEGVFVFCKESNNLCITNNIARAKIEYIPASTFKIANSLIGLETGDGTNALSSAAAVGGRLRRIVRPEGQKGAP